MPLFSSVFHRSPFLNHFQVLDHGAPRGHSHRSRSAWLDCQSMMMVHFSQIQGNYFFCLFLAQIPGVDPSTLAHWLSTPPRFTVARKNPLVDEEGGGCSVEKKVQMLLEKVGNYFSNSIFGQWQDFIFLLAIREEALPPAADSPTDSSPRGRRDRILRKPTRRFAQGKSCSGGITLRMRRLEVAIFLKKETENFKALFFFRN